MHNKYTISSRGPRWRLTLKSDNIYGPYSCSFFQITIWRTPLSKHTHTQFQNSSIVAIVMELAIQFSFYNKSTMTRVFPQIRTYCSRFANVMVPSKEEAA